MSAVFRNREYCLHIVILGQSYGALDAALLTTLNDAVFARRALERDGLHHASASRRPVARLHVDMLAPETFGAVIGIPVTRDRGTAVFASEILDGSLEHT